MIRNTILLLALAMGTLTLTGCFDTSEDDQSVPWARPADWERGAPGFGGY